MATEGKEEVNAETPSVEPEADDVLTIGEVLEVQQQLIEDTQAVLGAADDKNCTYTEGYMKRQALYACLTCIPEAKADFTKSAGVCLACCYHCHDGHELVELYTKRNFRCDCGNKRFTDKTCTLYPTKTDFNENNSYNHNFSGLYCSCERPYPDPEDPVSDEMIQCIICEDWYHSRHLDVTIPNVNSYEEVTCENCMKTNDFLLHYDDFCASKSEEGNKSTAETEEANKSSVETEESKKSNSESDEGKELDVGAEAKKPVESEDLKKSVESEEANKSTVESQEPIKSSIVNEKTEASSSDKTDKSQDEIMDQSTEESKTDCKKPALKSTKVCTKFWADVSWRQQLCTCSSCSKLYEEKKVSFLLDPQDSVHTYEETGKVKAMENVKKQEQKEMEFLNSLDRVPLLEAIAGYNDMKTHLVEYLRKFAENKKVVREEDIREFFSGYDPKKRPKCDIPHYCR